jgi:hypothetical protein
VRGGTSGRHFGEFLGSKAGLRATLPLSGAAVGTSTRTTVAVEATAGRSRATVE